MSQTNELTNSGLKILVKGSGDTVIAQTPDPGSSVPSGGTVVVYTDEASMNQTVTVPNFTNRHCRMSTTWLHKQG